MRNDEIKNKALEFARREGNRIAKELTSKEKYKPDAKPVSIFMAGSPGAGKTEYSKNVVLNVFKRRVVSGDVIRIDGDDYRDYFDDYTGENSSLFQAAMSTIVAKVHDQALKQEQSFVLDGTFSKCDRAVKNINRSLKRDRSVFVFYIYQDPIVAWRFTKDREIIEGRNIPKETFIEQYFGAMDTVRKIRDNFDSNVTIFLIVKNFEKHAVEKMVEINTSGSEIDEHIQNTYTLNELKKIL